MQRLFLELTTVNIVSSVRRRAFVYQWSEIETAINTAFASGGEVILRTLLEDPDCTGAYLRRDHIWMQSVPGKYILLVFPFFDSRDKRPENREWKETCADNIGQEGLIFNDIRYNPEFVCTDLNVAKKIFQEFFNSKAITQQIKNLTVSQWEM